MVLKVIGAGLGRTGTLSLMIALERLGCGPCHHMDVLLANLERQLPLWQTAVDGRPNWAEIFSGYASAVDWPTASFYRELHAAYPQAKFILTHRSPESWLESFSETIRKVLDPQFKLPPEMEAWRQMTRGALRKSGIATSLDDSALLRVFQAHNDAVRSSIPAHQLLLFQVKDGWEPLCSFLNEPMPSGDFPRTNDRAYFWRDIPTSA